MKHLKILKAQVDIRLNDYFLEGSPVINQIRKIKNIS